MKKPKLEYRTKQLIHIGICSATMDEIVDATLLASLPVTLELIEK